MKHMTWCVLVAALATQGCSTLGWPDNRAVEGDEILKRLEVKDASGQETVQTLSPTPLPVASVAAAPAPAPAPVAAPEATFLAAAPAEAAPAPAPAPEPKTVVAAKPVAKAAPAAAPAKAVESVGKTHVVKSGDTLQKISQNYYGTTKRWFDIYTANKERMKRPDLIVPGMKLSIP